MRRLELWTEMRALAVAALAALVVSPSSVGPGFAQTEEPGIHIDWEVKNRFRLFKRSSDFQRHVAAARAGNQFAAEHQLESLTGGRGWAQEILPHLCVNAAGTLLETCERDGERENYLAPKTHPVVVRLTGAVPPGATCNWSFDDGTIPPKQVNAPCTETVQQRVAYGKPTIAAVGITRPDNSVESVSTEIQVRDLLIAGLGDSVAAGEGNPDRPVALADEGFCFQRFLGAVRGEYFRPSRAGYRGDKACEGNPAGTGSDATNDWSSQGALWMSAACHRSLYGYQVRTALTVAIENRQAAVTFIPLACSGATIDAGLLGSQGASDCPPTGRCAGTVPAQVAQLADALTRVRRADPNRKLDLVLLTVGANDIKFSGLVADVTINPGVERVLFNQGGLITTVPESQALLDRTLPQSFARLRTALKPLVGGNLARVVYVSYGHPAMNGDQPCPGGRDGLDVHPSFNADGRKLKLVTDFVMNQFMPKLHALARCERGVVCGNPETDRMTFIDTHQDAFARHGLCVRASDDPEFDRDCFSPDGKSFDPDPVTAASSPLVCPRRPSEFRPYAPRARWIRTANDSYFTAMTFPRGLPSTMQPSNIHDAAWGALSAVYGGAFHPTAEGHAVMADAALPAVRDVLGLKAPASVTTGPLPPLR